MVLEMGHIISIIVAIIGAVALIIVAYINNKGNKNKSIVAEQNSVVANSPIPLSFLSWKKWNYEITLKAGKKSNEIIINGTLSDAGGFTNTSMNTNLRGKILILFFSNTKASRFSQSRMAKIEYNKDDALLRPTNASLLFDGYLPAEDTPAGSGIEFKIPDNFDGKINFVFYQAELNDLKITAWYQ